MRLTVTANLSYAKTPSHISKGRIMRQYTNYVLCWNFYGTWIYLQLMDTMCIFCIFVICATYSTRGYLWKHNKIPHKIVLNNSFLFNRKCTTTQKLNWDLMLPRRLHASYSCHSWLTKALSSWWFKSRQSGDLTSFVWQQFILKSELLPKTFSPMTLPEKLTSL